MTITVTSTQLLVAYLLVGVAVSAAGLLQLAQDGRLDRKVKWWRVPLVTVGWPWAFWKARR
jgi:hypothetical protein